MRIAVIVQDARIAIGIARRDNFARLHNLILSQPAYLFTYDEDGVDGCLALRRPHVHQIARARRELA